jgi:hypothetical protein
MRRVSVEGTPRGGLLTQASMLRLNAPGTRTSPVNRGKWVLEVILGAAPIRPPAGILQALQETSMKSNQATLSKQLEEHRTNPSCAQCHHKMDVIGMALENFDELGIFETIRADRPIESTGTLPDGEVLEGAVTLKKYLGKHREQFVRGLGERMLRFSLGRNLEDRDRAALEGLPAAVAGDEHRFSRVILQVVLSESFRRGFASGN